MPPTINVQFASQHPEEHELLHGVESYVNDENLDWEVVPLLSGRPITAERIESTRPPAVFIGRFSTEHLPLRRQDVPWVDWVAEGKISSAESTVQFDATSIGLVAAEYILKQGARTLAIRGPLLPENTDPNADAGSRQARYHAFVKAAAQFGHICHVIWQPPTDHESYLKDLITFCQRMPKPIAFFSYHDTDAEYLINELLKAGINIPTEVMVLGASSSAESAKCEVPVSSVRLPFRALGRAAAMQAHRLLSGSTTQPLSIKALGVIERDSTVAMRYQSDPIINRALGRVARKDRPIPSVSALATFCKVHRQLLNTRFKSEFGTNPKAWLEERVMQRAAELLAETELSTTEIAKQCGIAQRTNLSARFRKRFGLSPKAYRKRARNPC